MNGKNDLTPIKSWTCNREYFLKRISLKNVFSDHGDLHAQTLLKKEPTILKTTHEVCYNLCVYN